MLLSYRPLREDLRDIGYIRYTRPFMTTANIKDLQNNLKDPSLGSTPQHPFSTPENAQYWSDVYETAKYEGRHRFNPTCRLVRKRIMAWTIYLTSFLAAELPGGLLSKKISPDVMTPIAIYIWGDRTGFFITRALLGFSQGGFIPEMVLYLSYFFKSNELPIRLSIFWTAIPLTQIIGSLLAAGFLKMRGLHDWSGWQWLFLIEGLMSVTVGLVTFVVMPASITESGHILRGKASWLHGKTGWFTEREEKIGVNRILRDDPSKGDMNNRQYVSLQGIWQAVKDIDLWPTYMLGIVAFIPFQPAANYLSLTLRNLGYTVFEANMLAIPGYTLFFINILTVVWLSERYRERLIFGATSNFWVLPFLIALVTIPSSASPWVRYALLTGVNGEPYTHAILVGMISRNANSVGTRAVSAAVYNICYQIGSIVAVNVYRNDDKPYYYRGNKILVGLASANIVLFFWAKLYYIKRNQQKERQWRLLSDFDQANYLSTTKDTGTKRLDIRFAH
ncbi:major facilitator superfamily domain-containing protein [Exophiala viscosa]|uniref:major facilitator superfamily domain-containing protein n=1 Tax=Exophiala viscosa TaxID=2486360 RepID=UPI002192A9AA|nr:major facilitator superfamily domain-containing protein [Exophiala viscosa]